MKAVIILPTAAVGLRKHKSEARRLMSKIEAYAANPQSSANKITKLVGSDEYRMRVGEYRIIFTETVDEIIVTRIGPRGSVYD